MKISSGGCNRSGGISNAGRPVQGRRALVALSCVLLVAGGPASAQEEETVGIYETIVLTPSNGTVLSWNGRRYAGRLEVRSAPDGLVIAERVEPEDYLLGIQEVPFSWHEEALKAQVVAARTYLAWTLSRGRAGSGETYGFDICATPACQVYGGLDQVQALGGERWAAAVAATDDQVLLYNGSPAQALYSSTTGGRTRDVRDVFGGSGVPYLTAVDSPDEASPLVGWSFEIPRSVLQAVLHEAGWIDGRLLGTTVRTTADGAGAWTVEVNADGRTRAFTTWEFRGVMNRYGSQIAPDLLPAERPDGKRYPQTVMSPTYTVAKTWRYPEEFRSGFIVVEEVYTFSGKGWGHLVGMSQYGALAMAEAGGSYDEILAHYYGGLQPQPAGAALGDEIVVGLGWGEPELVVSADGPIDVFADGESVAVDALGTWRFSVLAGDVGVHPPEGFGLPPGLRDLDPVVASPVGSSVVVTGTLAAAAEVRLVVFDGPGVVGETLWTLRDAGQFALVWEGTVHGLNASPGRYRALIEARSPQGEADSFITIELGDQPQGR
ncbi:MAG: SpoIID/LytB domain-containing protein [Acidimicrobiia bacterium]